MTTLFVFCCALIATTSFAGVHQGFHLRASSAQRINVRYVSDTTMLVGPAMREHQSADGLHRQIIASADIIVPSESGFVVESQASTVWQGALQMPPLVHQQLREQRFPAIQNSAIEVKYLGVSADRHIARLSVVVAEQRGASPMIMYKQHEVSIGLKGQAVGGRPTPMMLSVLNPGAPYWIPRIF